MRKHRVQEKIQDFLSLRLGLVLVSALLCYARRLQALCLIIVLIPIRMRVSCKPVFLYYLHDKVF